MQKIKNKFIIFIIIIIISIIWFGVYNSYFNNIDRDSYVLLVDWNATLNSLSLKPNEKEIINVWDTIRTLWNSSLAILEWWDGSVTRLWWNTTVKIDNLYLSKNLDTINIKFNLLSWKSWSNVISFLWSESYFKQEFSETVAAVRWTIFDVDLTNDYLYVIDHKVTLTKSDWEQIEVLQNKPINLTNFDFISLEEFLSKFKDKAWEKLNNWFDINLLKSLEEQVTSDLNELINIDDLNIDKVLDSSDLKKEELYNKILTDYQKLNFIKSDNEVLFKKKIELKEALIKLSSDENKQMLMQNTFYDFNNIIDSKNYDNLDILLPILESNKELLKSLNFNKITDFNSLPEKIKNKFIDLKILIIETSSIIDNKIKENLENLK